MKTSIELMLPLVLAAMIFSGCQNENAAAIAPKVPENAVAQNAVKQISVREAREAVKAENVQFIDVRTREEYAGGRVPKTLNFPLDNLENDLTKLDKNKPVYVICQTGRRSQKASEILQKAGFADVYNIQGGTSEWIEAGYPTEK